VRRPGAGQAQGHLGVAVLQLTGRRCAEGFLLPADALQIDAAAAGSEIGLPAPTG